MAESLAEALAALADEQPEFPLSERAASLVPHVAAIIAAVAPAGVAPERVERAAVEILEIYHRCCWQFRQEADAGVQKELAMLRARLEALQAAIAGLSEETRRQLDHELASLARRLWYLRKKDDRWELDGSWNQDGQKKLGLARSLLELDLMGDATDGWPRRPASRPTDELEDEVAGAALAVYEDLIGLTIKTNFRENRRDRAFVDFLRQLYGLLGIDVRSVEAKAEKAVKSRKHQRR